MEQLKQSNQVETSQALTTVAGLAAPSLLALGLRAVGAMAREFPQRSVDTVTTNVAGPQFPLYAAGRRMVAYLPFVPLAQGVRIGVAIMSYDGGVSFGVTGDYDTVPDLEVFCRSIEAGDPATSTAVPARSLTCERADPSNDLASVIRDERPWPTAASPPHGGGVSTITTLSPAGTVGRPLRVPAARRPSTFSRTSPAPTSTAPTPSSPRGRTSIGLLVLFAAVVLLFRGRYHRGIFDLVMGRNRWVYRVIARAASMADHYPPFRLDQGGDDPPQRPKPTFRCSQSVALTTLLDSQTDTTPRPPMARANRPSRSR